MRQGIEDEVRLCGGNDYLVEEALKAYKRAYQGCAQD